MQIRKYIIFVTTSLFFLFYFSSCHVFQNNKENSTNCGNGIVETDEECDGTDLNVTNCEDLGFQNDPFLTCTNDCKIDTSACKTRWTSVSPAVTHTCAIKENGELFCWGYNYYGQLGTENNTEYSVPHKVGSYWKVVSTGAEHTCAIKENGELFCWGGNILGQLGIGSEDDQLDHNFPVQVENNNDWTDISSGGYHSCALKTDHSLYCWGDNVYGQLGTGDASDYNIPTRINHVFMTNNWQMISCGRFHTCGITTDGSLYCWGANSYGQLGTGDNNDSLVPVQTGSDSNWIQVSAGQFHTCALKDDYSLYCWGNNTLGQLGTGNTTDQNLPVKIGNSSKWIQVSLRKYHTCAIKENGELFCWGYNYYGQLGLGDETDRYLPMPVNLNTEPLLILTFAAGYYHTCGITTDGSLYCWGRSSYWQLGTGNMTNQNLPVRIEY